MVGLRQRSDNLMTGATGRREARAIRRACPQEAIRRASLKPGDAGDRDAAAAIAAATLAAAAPVGLAATAEDASFSVHMLSVDEEEDEMPKPIAPQRMHKRVSRKEKSAVRRACPKEGLRRASIRPDAFAHEAVIQAAIEADRSSAPPSLEGGAVAEHQSQSPSRPHSADFSPRTKKAVRRAIPKKALSFREREQHAGPKQRNSVPEPADLTDLAAIGKERAGACPPGAAFPA